MNTEYLMETAKEYREKYPYRLTKFISEFEADEIDYIQKEIKYLKTTLYDLQNSEASHNGHSRTGIRNFTLAYDVVRAIGWEKFLYSTKNKIAFLKSQKKSPDQQTNSEAKLSLREIALLCFFKNEKITIGNQDIFAKMHGQNNIGQKLFAEHYHRIVEDEKEIYQHKYAKKYLNNIKQFFESDTEVLKKIDTYIQKAY